MIKFIVSADVVRGAQLFQGKQDVRYYLNGIFIGKNGKVAGANGHALFVSDHNAGIKKDYIIQLEGVIPAMANEVEFIVMSSDKQSMVIAHCYNAIKSKEKIIGGKLIDGTYPDIDKVIPDHSEAKLKKSKGINMLGLNAGYMASAHKALGNYGVKMTFLNENESVVCRSSNPELPENTMVIIMPTRV